MSKSGKLEAEVEIKASPEKFFETFCAIPHNVIKASTNKVKALILHDGEFGKQGSIISWDYIHDGKLKTVKKTLEAIDHEKKSIVFKVVEGELMNDYKSFKVTFVAIPKIEGSIIHWTIEYEKSHVGIEHPETLVQLVVDITKDVCAHIRAQA